MNTKFQTQYLTIEEYPLAIRNSQLELLDVSSHITNLLIKENGIKLEIMNQIIEDTSLTNETKRNVAKTNLLNAHPTYWEIKEELELHENRKKQLEIELGYLNNCFDVLKLNLQTRRTAV